jgi:hypothetical protein
MHPTEIAVPRGWIEGRLDQTAPRLSLAAITELESQQEQLGHLSVAFSANLRISYVPKSKSLQRWIDEFGLAEAELLRELKFDLSRGAAVQSTTLKTRDGLPKFAVLGTRWRLVVRPQSAKNSSFTLAVLDGIHRLDVPTNQIRFPPVSVSFHPIWDEAPADPTEWLGKYRTCKSQKQDIERRKADLSDQLREIRGERQDELERTSRALRTPSVDCTVRERSDAHSLTRRKFSALRVMMDLLRLRSDQDKHRFPATVRPETAESPKASEIGTGSGRYLRLAMNGPVAAGILTEDTLVELFSTGLSRPKRARIRAVVEDSGVMIIELDLPSDAFGKCVEVEVHTVSRFGMWAHQRAIHDLFEERVEGYWPTLAQLLCSPKGLKPLRPATCDRYFCDFDPGRPKLNERQRLAVAGALGSDHAFCIQGPPGTGKTTVICELVQQLLAKGERILLVAPTHVAIDEVLRRIGSRDGVRALRLSWDDAKVADDVRKFTPANVIDPFLDRLGNDNTNKRRGWNAKRQSLADAAARLERLVRALDLHDRSIRQRQLAEATAQRAHHAVATEGSELRTAIGDLTIRLPQTEAVLAQLSHQHAAAETDVKSIRAQASWANTLLGWIGFGPIGEAAHRCSQLHKLVTAKQEELTTEVTRRDSNQTRLNDLERELLAANSVANQATATADDAQRDKSAAEISCREHSLIGNRLLDAGQAAILVEDFRKQDERLVAYLRLVGRFDELVAAAREESQDLEGLRRELLAVTNLFCCTTTGVAGSPELRDVVFDTLIVDEASRVTDSEFLIGAVRARRWILVGDEHQLPPYVEQNDEHFIHALSALHQANVSGKAIEAAVDELGHLWEEDEELHRFRRDSVLQFAERMRESGEWESIYRAAYQTGIDYLSGEVSDPSKALLQAMRESLIHSLFERVVRDGPASMKVRLVEQRRMIEPIAAIVSTPVYHGDYQTPPPEELARSGVTPLTTPSFPTPVTFLDTSLLGIAARDELIRNSFINKTEARWIVEACRTLDRELAQAGDGPITVSILAFYKAQTRLIRDQLNLHRFVRLRFSVIDAIDRIQGQESDIVFLSFCRTSGKNVSATFGQWLQDVRRLNVACTRAHRALIFVGQRELLGRLCANPEAMEFYRHLDGLFDSRSDVMRVVRQFSGGGK